VRERISLVPILFWDASALAKRYLPELGTEVVDALFASTGVSSTLATTLEPHNLNATDGAILALALRYVHALPAGSPTSLFVAADRRLLSAAQAEGLRTLNPETAAATDIPPFLASI
jgi:hypothetical protein